MQCIQVKCLRIIKLAESCVYLCLLRSYKGTVKLCIPAWIPADLLLRVQF